MIRIKICGIRDRAFLESAQQLNIHAIGLMFYKPSKRFISIEKAVSLLKDISPLLQVVAVFVNPSIEWVEQVLATVPVHSLQFHGDEDDVFCKQFNRPYIKAISFDANTNIKEQEKKYPNAGALLLDSGNQQQRGGTGQQFNWQMIPHHSQKPLIIAGGINPENVGLLAAKPYVQAIDISSGIESSPGEKCIKRLNQLLYQIKEGV